MYFIIYEITNKMNGMIYVGQHITDDLDDGYMGSGIRITNAYKKHGKSIFSKKILFVFNNFEDMDKKEAEIVNEDFIKRSDTYNVVLGGTGWCSAGTVVVESIDNPGIFYRIPKKSYNKSIHKTPTTDSILVYSRFTDERMRISVGEYKRNKNLYITGSSGKVSVLHKETGKTLSISMDDFDIAIHKKVFGGIVANKNGINQYISADDFYNNGYKGIHSGKVTVFDKVKEKSCHISTREYMHNKDRYITNGAGTVPVKDIKTGKSYRIDKDTAKNNPDLIIGTTGQITVYDIGQKKFINIPKGTFDRTKHRLSQDRKIICYEKNGNIKFEFWGGKTEFLEKYKCPRSVWDTALREAVFISDRKKSSEFNGCYFRLIDWKKS